MIFIVDLEVHEVVEFTNFSKVQYCYEELHVCVVRKRVLNCIKFSQLHIDVQH